MSTRTDSVTESASTAIRQIVFGCGAGFLLLGFLLAVSGITPLLKHMMQEQRRQLTTATQTRAFLVKLYLTRIKEISTQVASRTYVRHQLKEYELNRIPLQQYRKDTKAVLMDAVQATPGIVGLIQLDANGAPVISIGKTVPEAIRHKHSRTVNRPVVTGPYSGEHGNLIVVFAPVFDRSNTPVGMDAITFDASPLHLLLSRHDSSLPYGRPYLAKFSNGVIRIFARDQHISSEVARRDHNFLERAVRLFSETSEPHQPQLFTFRKSLLLGQVVSLVSESDANWFLAVNYDIDKLYLPVYQRAALTFILLSALVIGGLAILILFLRPLGRKLKRLTRQLQNQITERKQVETRLVARLAQQAAVAELGRFALTGPERQALLDEAVRITAKLMNVDLCKVLELDLARSTCILRAGVGWTEGLVGHAEVPIDRLSQAGYTLRSGQPVIVHNLATETRFSGPDLLTEHNVVSGVSVVIGHGNPWGVLGAHSRQLREFSQYDVNFLQAVANCLAEAISRYDAENRLRIEEERYRILFHENPSMLFTLDRGGTVINVNSSGAAQLGYTVNELTGANINQIIYFGDRQLSNQYLNDCFFQSNQVHRWEIRKTRKDGSILWVRETARILKRSTGEMQLFIICEDISEARLLSDQLSYQASHDQLTGLANRREFELRLARLLAGVRQDNEQHALAYLDLDQFKVVNDTCGHVAGDEMLKQLTAIISKNIRREDTLARLGGDEFGVLMKFCDMERAQTIADKILKEIDEFRFKWEDHVFTLGSSIGLVPINRTSGNVGDIMRNADSACYVAKEQGRNRIHIYEENNQDIVRWHGEMMWISKLNEALDKSLFQLCAQPIIPLASKAPACQHHEILVRLVDNRKELIPPGDFLSTAERYNLATRVDRWVIETLFQRLQDSQRLREKLGVCSINLSGQSIADEEFSAFLIEKLKSGLNPASICFEITETAAIANLSRAQDFMKILGNLGCTFALDDFGSGLSSFAYLKSLPVNYLKIDGIFVKNMDADGADFAMVRSIHQIGTALGKRTIAEFVENDAIKEILVEIGVDYGQGYVLGHPQLIVG